MRPRTLFGQIFPLCLLLVALSLSLASWQASRLIHRFHREQAKADLVVRARLVEELLAGRFAPSDAPEVDALCKRLASERPMRITVILPTGQVIGDSEEDPARMDNHSRRDEVVQALREGTGASIRFSHTIQREMLYVAVAATDGNRTAGVVRLAVSLPFLHEALEGVYRDIVWAGVLIALLVGAISLIVSRRISRPLRELKETAERLPDHQPAEGFAVSGSEEIEALSQAINRMVGQLDGQIRTAVRQQNEIETVLSQMAEGVLVVNAEEKIVRLNPAAATLLKTSPDETKGRSLLEVVRSAELQRLLTTALSDPAPREGEILVHDHEGILLGVRASRLEMPDGKSPGVLVVLSDLTRLRKLERVRRDFVANVSHELKTPATTIKGFVETLLGGAADNPEDRERFLKIIARQTDQLSAIIEDLLTLSQIEEETNRGGVTVETHPLLPTLEAALECCQWAASQKEMTLNLICPEDLKARLNPALFEQAVVNLLDNAVKYGNPGTEVRLETRGGEGGIRVSVQDQGLGIPSEHLPRLFERFYRVDKARSRKSGGTGLGLSIVKHIVQAHGGRVTVESAVGRGSVFTIHLPLPKDADPPRASGT